MRQFKQGPFENFKTFGQKDYELNGKLLNVKKHLENIKKMVPSLEVAKIEKYSQISHTRIETG